MGGPLIFGLIRIDDCNRYISLDDTGSSSNDKGSDDLGLRATLTPPASGMQAP